MANQEKFISDLLAALRHGTFVRDPTVSEEINDYAEDVKRKLDALTAILDERGIMNIEGTLELVASLKTKLEGDIEKRRNAQATGMMGTTLKILGLLFKASTIGQVAFWGGFAVSVFSDIYVNDKREKIRNLSSKIAGILERDRESFRTTATAIRKLDEAVASRTGKSIYDPSFREFLKNAAESPERARNFIAREVDNPEHRKNLVEMVRNCDLSLLERILEGCRRKDVVFLSLVTQSAHAVYFLNFTPEVTAAIHVGELALRGITMYIEYEEGRLMIEEFELGMAIIRKQLEALREVYPNE